MRRFARTQVTAMPLKIRHRSHLLLCARDLDSHLTESNQHPLVKHAASDSLPLSNAESWLLSCLQAFAASTVRFRHRLLELVLGIRWPNALFSPHFSKIGWLQSLSPKRDAWQHSALRPCVGIFDNTKQGQRSPGCAIDNDRSEIFWHVEHPSESRIVATQCA
ncbi:hypothetical protein EJ03DRAFT_117082 [Teratosphaeria nubilosa]|uniref:Uncharacterized protein n=1 Tax=Teratosphaeria nubilosa TaxID=161662 RepID=A0A6G1L7H2_9PEZI|nr:hypothetical protein EJ03DRAFT_117082 [Teratosphaeria nubilosa]